MGYHPSVPISFRVLAVMLGGTIFSEAELTVNPAEAMTRRVVVQPIRVSRTDGTAAVTFGTPASETYIKEQINRAWAQVGVWIHWLPMAEYTSNFAYQGTGNYETEKRPMSDLDAIVSGAPSPPKSPDATVINLFFVEIVPWFNHLPDNYVNGLAFVDANGITAHVGSSLVGYNGGRDAIASVLAHEIGHNLGLEHIEATDNLMKSGESTAERLTAAQKAIILTNNSGIDGYDFLRPSSNYQKWSITAGLVGGPAGDDDLDGIRNVVEFMFGLNPKSSGSLPAPVIGADGLTWTLPKQTAAIQDGLVYRVETSATLAAGSWASAGADTGRSVVLQDNASNLVVRLQSGAASRFMRLNVTVPGNVTAAASPEPSTQTLVKDAPRVISEPTDVKMGPPSGD